MSPLLHRIYIGLMVCIVILSTIYLSITGYSFYRLPIEERFYHPHYDWFKPSGIYGQGLGILGTSMILFGVLIYIARKRYNLLARYIRLKYLLEFHIFLCTLGPIIVVFHTSFKFGGIVSIAFWSMLAVVLSGVIGRFIYIQIPKSIEGRTLSLKEVNDRKNVLTQYLQNNQKIKPQTMLLIQRAESIDALSLFSYFSNRSLIQKIQYDLIDIDRDERLSIVDSIKEEITLSQKIGRLEQMQRLFKYWHVAHLPFALIMLIIVVVHVVVVIGLGYKWIF